MHVLMAETGHTQFAKECLVLLSTQPQIQHSLQCKRFFICIHNVLTYVWKLEART